jgi:hypothetical protein
MYGPLKPRAATRARSCLMLTGALVLLSASAVAQEKETGVMQAEAIDTFKAMSQHLSKAETLSFTTSGLREIAGPSGIKYLHGRTGFVVLQRPDHLHAQALREDGQALRVWFDGQSLTIAVSDADDVRYATIAAPEGATTIDGILDHLEDRYDFVLQLGDLLYGDVYGTLGDALLSAVYLGPKLVDGRPCHHLSLEFAGADAQLWVQEGDDPIPCRWAFTLLDAPSEPLFVSSFDSWVSNLSVDPARFEFVVPAGATEVKLEELLAERGAGAD